jgi:hypothetical protein
MLQYPPATLCGRCESFFTDTTVRNRIFSETGHDFNISAQSIKDSSLKGCEICTVIYDEKWSVSRVEHVLRVKYERLLNTLMVTDIDNKVWEDSKLYGGRCWMKRVYATSGE